MVTDDVLAAVALAERIEPMLKKDKRDQLSKTNLEAISRISNQILNRVADKPDVFDEVSPYYIGIQDLINTLLQEERFDLTDNETKNLIIKNADRGLSAVYLAAGKFYYDSNDFKYNVGLDALLQRIIDVCIDRGIYFGYA